MSSFLVIGLGRFGSTLASELYEMGHEVFAVDKIEDRVARMTNNVTHAVVGNVNDESVIGSFGIADFDCVILAIADSLEDSVLITLMVKELGAKRIVCKAQDEQHEKVLLKVGADTVVRPEHDMGKRTAHVLGQKHIIDVIELSPDYQIAEVTAPREWSGRTIGECDLRRRYGITVLAISRGRGHGDLEIDISPGADAMIQSGDALVVVGSNESVDEVGALS